MIRLKHMGDGHWQAVAKYDRQLSAAYPVGSIVSMDPQQPRSRAHHNWWFALVDNSWSHLSPDWQARLPSPEALRAYVLIKAGWCESEMTVLDSPDDAVKMAAVLRRHNPLAIIKIEGNIVYSYFAKSQRIKAQKRKEFREVTERGTMVLAQMLGVDPVTLLANTEAA